MVLKGGVDGWWLWQLPGEEGSVDLGDEPWPKMMHISRDSILRLEARRPGSGRGRMDGCTGTWSTRYPDGQEKTLLVGVLAGAIRTADRAYHRGRRR